MDVPGNINASSNNLDLDLEDDEDVDLAPLYQAGSQYISAGCPLICDPPGGGACPAGSGGHRLPPELGHPRLHPQLQAAAQDQGPGQVGARMLYY